METYYVVSINLVTSSSVTESELADLLGASTPSALECRPRNKSTLFWRYEPISDKTLPLIEHVCFIGFEINPSRPIRLNKKIKRIYLDIGVFYDANRFMLCPVTLPMDCLAPPCREDS